jgi:hypothetical protein
MTIKVTVEVPDAKIGKLISQLDGFKVLCEHVPVEVPKSKTNGAKMHSRAESILTMTGKTPNKNSKLAKALEIFEKLEKRMGIGQVNAAAFRIELVKKKQSKGLAQRCVTEKVLAYL